MPTIPMGTSMCGPFPPKAACRAGSRQRREIRPPRRGRATAQWIYFSENRAGGRDIWRVPATGGPAQRVTRTGTGFLAYESADGTSLLYQPKFGDSPLLVMPLTGDGAPQPLVDCVRPAAFATAGHAVVYVACEPGTNPPLHSIDMASGRDRLLGRLEHFPPDTIGYGPRRVAGWQDDPVQRACASRRRPDADRKFPVRH